MNKKISVLVLAAGKGTRMKSAIPKVLHPVGGRSLLQRVLSTVGSMKPHSLAVVLGHGREQVAPVVKACSSADIFVQKKLDGSGGAVRSARAWVARQPGDIVVMCGDTPLISKELLTALWRRHQKDKNSATVLSVSLSDAHGYGRIVRRPDGSVEKIVEELDATKEQRQIREINTGAYVFSAPFLAWALPRLKADNAKHEYYLTDVLEAGHKKGLRIGAFLADHADECLGINSRADLAAAEAALHRRTLKKLMESGVSVVDPATTYIDDTVRIGPDTLIYPQTIIRGRTVIGGQCHIGPWAQITDCRIKKQVVLTASFADSSDIDDGAVVGPYSRLRPGSRVGKKAHVGNFSELKKTILGPGSKANHLSYLGDAKIGKNVNIGAGCITCNYDGVNKFPTFIEDHSFVGSNVNLIAPVRLGAGSVIGAGSSITDDVPAGALAVERAKAVLVPGWAARKFKNKKKRKGHA